MDTVDIGALPFHKGSKAEQVALLLLNGDVWSREALSSQADVSSTTIPRVVKALQDKVGLKIRRLVKSDGKKISYQVVLPSEGNGWKETEAIVFTPTSTVPVHATDISVDAQGPLVTLTIGNRGSSTARFADRAAPLPMELFSDNAWVTAMHWCNDGRLGVEVHAGVDAVMLVDVQPA